MNRIAIGICLVGNFNNEEPSKKQFEALVYLANLFVLAEDFFGRSSGNRNPTHSSLCSFHGLSIPKNKF